MGSELRHFTLRAAFLLCLTLAFHIPARAEEQLPPELKNVGIDPKLGTTIPLNLTFTDENGKQVVLADYFKKDKPVILTLVYYECPMLCTLVLNGFTDGLQGLPWTPGDQFEVVTISFNPSETPALAKAKKESYMGVYKRPQAASGWHFLTGKQAEIKALTDAVGFKYAWDPVHKQYAHATGIFILTSSGKLSRVLFGIDYHPRDMRLALTEAAEGKVGTIVDKLLLFCFHYDPQTKGYAVTAFRVMQLAGSLTVLILAGSIGSLLLWERRNRRKGGVMAPESQSAGATEAGRPDADAPAKTDAPTKQETKSGP